MKEIEEEITTLEELIDTLKPKSIFIAYECHGPEDLPAARPCLAEEMAKILLRCKAAASKKTVVHMETVYRVVIESTYFKSEWKYAFVNSKAKWAECIKSDLAFVYTVDGEWKVIKAEGYEPYRFLDIE